MTPGCDVLVIDDDRDCRELVAFLLGDAGYAVETASGGAQGLAMARRTAPHLILLDMVMPEMDAAQFLRRQRADPALAAVPVVLMSGVPSLPQRSADLAVEGHLAKPFDFREMNEVVARFVPDCAGR